MPQEVEAFTQTWNAEDDFISNLMQYYEVTGNKRDEVTNKELVQWASDNNFKISSIRIGIEMQKLTGVAKRVTKSGAAYTGVRKVSLVFQNDF